MFGLKKKTKKKNPRFCMTEAEEKVTKGYPLITCRGFYKYVVANQDLSNVDLCNKITSEPTFGGFRLRMNSYDLLDCIIATRNAIDTA